MSTIDDKQIIDAIISAAGRPYADEPPVVLIVEYTNAWGALTWGVVWADEPREMWGRYLQPTPYVQQPRIVFDRRDRPA